VQGDITHAFAVAKGNPVSVANEQHAVVRRVYKTKQDNKKMATKHICICDKCGNEQETTDQFWTIGITATHGLYTSNDYVAGKSMQVCRPCLESFGIHVQKKPQEAEQPKIITTEELIRELVARCT